MPEDKVDVPADIFIIEPTPAEKRPQTAPRPPAPIIEKIKTPDIVNFVPTDNNNGNSEDPIDIPNPEENNNNPFPPGSGSIAITEEEPIVEFLPIEDMPKFPGDILVYLSKTVRYPVIDQEQGISGKVICQFVIDKDGSIIDVVIVRGVSPTIDKEAIRVVKSMPKWTPGQQQGKAVKVKYTLPINFTLK